MAYLCAGSIHHLLSATHLIYYMCCKKSREISPFSIAIFHGMDTIMPTRHSRPGTPSRSTGLLCVSILACFFIGIKTRNFFYVSLCIRRIPHFVCDALRYNFNRIATMIPEDDIRFSEFCSPVLGGILPVELNPRYRNEAKLRINTPQSSVKAIQLMSSYAESRQHQFSDCVLIARTVVLKNCANVSIRPDCDTRHFVAG